MSIKVDNLEEVEAWAGNLLPEGFYPVRVIDADESTSSNNNPQIVLTMEVIQGEGKGAQIRDWITITAASLGRVKGILTALGYEIPPGEFELDAAALIGRPAHITVRHETWNEKTNAKVKAYDPAPEFPVLERQASAATTNDKDIPF